MSTGHPKETNTRLEQAGQLAVRSSMDMCKGCRRFCTSLIKTIGHSRIATSIVITLPMFAMVGFLIYLETYFLEFLQVNTTRQVRMYTEYYKNTLFSPFYTLAAITFGFGLLAILAIRCEYQNLLRFSAFAYRGIAHWILLTVFLLLIPIGGYLAVNLVFQIMMWSLIPAALWLFTAAVMTGHGDLITTAIEGRINLIRDIENTIGETSFV
jgi:hypothetical protein